MTNPPAAVQILLLLIAIPAAFFDLRERRVPNWLALCGLLLGFTLNGFLFQLPGVWSACVGMGLALLVYLPLWLLRGMGAGDVKLMAALGAIAGPWNWLVILALTSLLGGVAALILVIAQRRVRQTAENIGQILASMGRREAPYVDHPQLDVRSDQGLRLPHAVVIAFGVVGFLIVASIWVPR